MNDYAFYIWTSYGITAIALVATIIWPLLKRRRMVSALKRMQQRQSQLEKRRQ